MYGNRTILRSQAQSHAAFTTLRKDIFGLLWFVSNVLSRSVVGCIALLLSKLKSDALVSINIGYNKSQLPQTDPRDATRCARRVVHKGGRSV